jgi:hypothetical protein
MPLWFEQAASAIVATVAMAKARITDKRMGIFLTSFEKAVYRCNVNNWTAVPAGLPNWAARKLIIADNTG